MNKTAALLLCLLTPAFLLAESAALKNLRGLLDSGKLEEIITNYAEQIHSLSAEEAFCVAMAHYMSEDDDAAQKAFDVVIKKDPKFARAYANKGASLVCTEDFEAAAKCYKKAVELEPENERFKFGLAGAYFKMGKWKESLAVYETLKDSENEAGVARFRSALIFIELGEKERALAAFYSAKEKLDRRDAGYKSSLYNIGMEEFFRGDYGKSEAAFLEVAEVDPQDYQVLAKLIQVYCAQNKPGEIKKYRDALYRLRAAGKLKGALAGMFCFDQFKWKDMEIMAFERYESGGGTSVYIKHKYFVRDKDSSDPANPDLVIQTEYSPAVSSMKGKEVFVLCSQKGELHSTYPYSLAEDVPYETLRNLVIGVLEGKIVPGASSKPNTDETGKYSGSTIYVNME